MCPNQVKWADLFNSGKVPIMELVSSEAPLALLASHYIFNICYPVGLESVYTFLEYISIWTESQLSKVLFLIVSFLLCMYKFCTVLLACQSHNIPGVHQRIRISLYLILISLLRNINIIMAKYFKYHYFVIIYYIKMWWVHPTSARVMDSIHHKVVVSQGQGKPTTFGGCNAPMF